MNFERLEKNLTDVIKEAQIKMGYESHETSFNYMLSSLNNLIGEKMNVDEMKSALKDFPDFIAEKFGEVKISEKDSVFCFTISAKGADYVHDNTSNSDFISEFINTIRNHGCKFDDVVNVFNKYSDKVHIEKVSNDEFDYLIYFENGIPDDYYYCISLEGGLHVTYHRFTKEDYKELGF